MWYTPVDELKVYTMRKLLVYIIVYSLCQILVHLQGYTT